MYKPAYLNLPTQTITSPLFEKPVKVGFTLFDQIKTDLWEAHNLERKKHKLPEVGINEKLMVAAQKHAEWLAANKRTLSHTGINRSKPGDRVTKQGYKWVTVGENAAQGQPTVVQVMKAWMNSKGHKDNILNKQFMEMGIGIAETVDGDIYWICVFGTQPTAL